MGGSRGGAADPPHLCAGPCLSTVTFDGSLLGAPPGPRAVGGSQGGVHGSPRSNQVGRSPCSATSPPRSAGSLGRVRPAARREPAGGVMLDKGESEAAFIGSLRTHYNRNGTAESFAPTFKAAPHKAYSRTTSTVAAAAPLSGPERLQRQEQQLWDEREEELVEAQERRFAQLEDALEAREAKREAYLVHRLEASAAEKIAEHRRRQEAAAHQRVQAVQRAQHLPALKQAVAAARPVGGAAALQKMAAHPVFPASPALAAAVGQAAANIASLSGINTLQAGLDAGRAFSPGADSARGSLPPLGAGRMGWQEKQRAAASVQVDSVYAQIQAAKAAGSGRLLSPLDAAKAAADMKTVRHGRKPDAGEGSEQGEEEPGFDDALETAYAGRLRDARQSSQPSQPASLHLGGSGRASEAGGSDGADGWGQQESSRRGSRASMGSVCSGRMVAEATLLAEPTVTMSPGLPAGLPLQASLTPIAPDSAEEAAEREEDMEFSLNPAWAGHTNNAPAAEALAAVPFYGTSEISSPAAASAMSAADGKGQPAEEPPAEEEDADEGAIEQPGAWQDKQHVELLDDAQQPEEQPADTEQDVEHALQAEQAAEEQGEAEEEDQPRKVLADQAEQPIVEHEPAVTVELLADAAAAAEPVEQFAEEHSAHQAELPAEPAAAQAEQPAEEHSAGQAEQPAEELAATEPVAAEPELVGQHSAGQEEEPAGLEEGQAGQAEHPAEVEEVQAAESGHPDGPDAGQAGQVGQTAAPKAVEAEQHDQDEGQGGQVEQPAALIELQGSAAAVPLAAQQDEEVGEEPAGQVEQQPAEESEQSDTAPRAAAEPEVVAAPAEELVGGVNDELSASMKLPEAEAESPQEPAAAAADGKAGNGARQQEGAAGAAAAPTAAEPSAAAVPVAEASMPEAAAPEELFGSPAAAAAEELSRAAGASCATAEPEDPAAEVPTTSELPPTAAFTHGAAREDTPLTADSAEQPSSCVDPAPAEQLARVDLAACLGSQAQQLVHNSLLRLASCSLAGAVRAEVSDVAVAGEAEELGCPVASTAVPQEPSAVAAVDSAEAVGLTQRTSASLLFGCASCLDVVPEQQVTTAAAEAEADAVQHS